VYFATFVPVPAASRFRQPVLPFLMLFAAYVANWFRRAAWARRWSPAAIRGVSFTALWTLAHVEPFPHEARRADWHMLRGMAFAGEGRGREAAKEFRAVLKLDPRNARAMHRLGHEYLREGAMDEAVNEFQQVLSRDPEHRQVLRALGEVYQRQGKSQEAEACFARLKR
jgi:tetratricopeptide (TPR) repeat protein